MKDWFSHFISGSGAEIYDRLQATRPDYTGALRVLERQARSVAAAHDEPVTVLDVACGTAIASRTAFGRLSRSRVRLTGLDYDRGLLAVARRLWPGLRAKRADMVRAQMRERFDVVVCSFAYHHAEDRDKRALCGKLRSWVRNGGDVFVLEICLRRGEVRPYYLALSEVLRPGPDRELARRFLGWTMQHDREASGEWKVPVSRLREDFESAGFALHKILKVWSAAELPPDSGCFFLHFKPHERL